MPKVCRWKREKSGNEDSLILFWFLWQAKGHYGPMN